jgi:hypothetical protein
VLSAEGVDGVSGRHCALGPDVSSAGASGVAHLEYARDGHVFFWFGAMKTPALVRTPGDAGKWYCGTRDHGKPPDMRTGAGSIVIRELGLVLDESKRSGAHVVDLDRSRGEQALELDLGSGREAGAVSGTSCSQGYERCAIEAMPFTRVFVRATAPMNVADPVGVAHLFVLRGDDAAGGVSLSVLKPGAPATARVAERSLDRVHADALGDPVSCPPSSPGHGSVEISWSR